MERMQFAKDTHCRLASEVEQLRGLVPAPQEFNAEARLLQVGCISTDNCIYVVIP